MTPHFSLLVMIALVAFAVWRRVRSHFGPQPIRRARMTIRIVVFAALVALVIPFAARDPQLLAGLGGGLAAGVALGVLGLRLSRFEVDPLRGDCYVPNPYIGALVTAVLVLRLVWRLSMLAPQMHDPTG